MERKPIEEQINIWSLRFLVGVSTVAIVAGLSENTLEAITIGALGVVITGVMNFGISYIKAKSFGMPEIQEKGLLFLLTTTKLLTVGIGAIALYGLYEYLN